MEDFAAYIVKNLVTDPNSVEIRSSEDSASATIKLEIRVASEDIGKIIGRKGQTIQALRTILKRIGARLQKKVLIELTQPESNTLMNDEELSLDYMTVSSVEDFEEDSTFIEDEEPTATVRTLAGACHSCSCSHHHD
ncbi:KH domain-containing protein [Chlamydia sp.]|uniref:KH domain-containing protein n=1 Tax=Chlamydia sp. TaxID=35827 RepID=UPI0025BA929D|nr:KH domain-containing protein [Chlamydia sp.]MBQ8498590.1 KH domain-containing protein [Chlamydia sp.]